MDKPASPPGPGRPGTRVAVTVLALGTVSLITDVSSEMVTAVLPLYLMLGLHLGPLGYGVIDGLYTGATALLRLVGGYVADRIQRRKAVAGVGYAISAAAKLGLVAAGSSVPLLSAVIVADRAGKGLRTAPRDALITLSTPPDRLGRAFGVHRSMDSIGAFAGPLVAVAVLTASAGSFDAVFVTSFCIATLGVFVLATYVPDHRTPSWPAPTPTAQATTPTPHPPTATPHSTTLAPQLTITTPAATSTDSTERHHSDAEAHSGGPGERADAGAGAGPGAGAGVDAAARHDAGTPGGVSVRAAVALLGRREFRLVVVASVVMGLATVGDGFVYLVLQRHNDLAAGWFPLLAVGTSLAYLLLAGPLGHLADRVGRARVYLGGFGALAAVYVILGAGVGGTGALVVSVALYGTFYAATDGVLMALAGPLLPAALRTTGIALVQSGQSLAYLASSVLFGLAWQLWGPGPALFSAAAFAVLGLLLVTLVLRTGTTHDA
ncbi:MFS transporter [Dactylosporangium matsuzakiense]|uniref:MFS transporter n=1 Tax=Dactylosporangium matsuzakiense TaxID=53360 RepID=UPI0021C277EB|nr:MFS transporter [Dactylosporangium matsuzakiense]